MILCKRVGAGVGDCSSSSCHLEWPNLSPSSRGSAALPSSPFFHSPLHYTALPYFLSPRPPYRAAIPPLSHLSAALTVPSFSAPALSPCSAGPNPHPLLPPTSNIQLTFPVQDPKAPSNAPDLLVNVTGSVLHGPHVILGSQFPSGPSASGPGPGSAPSNSNSKQEKLAPQDHPRKFHEMFVLRQVGVEAGVQPKVSHWSTAAEPLG